MNKVDIIYFTKEDGKNKYLGNASGNSMSVIDLMNINDPLFKNLLGHKPHNLYCLVDGVEMELPNKTHQELKKIVEQSIAE